MVRYILRRLVLIVVVLAGLSVLTFAIARVIPADPVRLAAGARATSQQIEQLRAAYGYDKSLPEQYLTYMNNLLRGDWGQSVIRRRPVGADLARFFPATLELVIVSVLVAVLLGVPLGVISAVYRDRWPDQLSRFFVLGGVSIPSFWLAIILQLLLTFAIKLLPTTGRLDITTTPPNPITGMYTLDALLRGNLALLGEAMRYLVLPAFCLSLGTLATVARMVRSDVLDVLNNDYVRMERALGLPEPVIIFKYVLKNALLSTLTMVGLFFGYSLTGSVLVENVFAWPGIGKYAVDAALTKDFVPLLGVTLLSGLVFVIVNFVVDLLYGALDPRIHYA